MSHPDLLYLETFAAVVEAGGFGRAAARLKITQPAVSYRIGQLEERLGVKVFEEPRRRVILTSAGRALHDFCTRFLSELDVISAELAEGREPLGPLRVACPGAFGRNVVFPALLTPSLQQTPVELLFRQLDDILDLVESGAVELGIAYDIRVTSKLEFREIAREEFCLVVPKGGAPRDDASMEVITANPFVTYEECDYVFGKWFADVFGGRPTRWRTALRFSRLEEVLRMVAEGRGYTIAPTHAVIGGTWGERVELLRPSGRPRSYNPEYAVTRPGAQARPDVEELIQAVSAASAELIDDPVSSGSG